MIATCTECGMLYDFAEESAAKPDRLCRRCGHAACVALLAAERKREEEEAKAKGQP